MLADGVFVKDYMQLEIMKYDVPEPRFNEVMVQTKACGLCCWDSWLYRGVNAPGPYPYVIGHEGVGVVYKVGAGVTNLKVGDKVVIGKYTATELKLDGEDYSICRQGDVLAIVE